MPPVDVANQPAAFLLYALGGQAGGGSVSVTRKPPPVSRPGTYRTIICDSCSKPDGVVSEALAPMLKKAAELKGLKILTSHILTGKSI